MARQPKDRLSAGSASGLQVSGVIVSKVPRPLAALVALRALLPPSCTGGQRGEARKGQLTRGMLQATAPPPPPARTWAPALGNKWPGDGR